MGEIIRPMVNEDLAQAADLLFRSFNSIATKSGLPMKIKDPETAKAWAWSLMANKSTLKFVAEADGKVTGISCLISGHHGRHRPDGGDPDARQVSAPGLPRSIL